MPGLPSNNEDIMRNLTIEQTPIHALKSHDHNARTHSKRQIRLITNSIHRFGFCNPVIVDDDSKILAGQGRVKAAELLGHTSVPTVRLSHLSDAEKCACHIS
jgi:ParB-like chromosome segregation protein Spo0J